MATPTPAVHGDAQGPANPVAAFVDYENIRISLRNSFRESVSPVQVAATIRGVGRDQGNFVGGVAYADWSRDRDAARAFQDHGFEPKMVLTKRGGADRSDIALALDLYDFVQERKDIRTLLLVSGDADFQEVVRRAQLGGKVVVVCGVTSTTARGLISMASGGFIAIESKLALTPARETTEALSSAPTEYDWIPFIAFIAELEARNKFVGLRKLVNEFLADPSAHERVRCGPSPSDRNRVIDAALREGILVKYGVDFGGTQVAACKLAQGHPLVRSVIEGRGT